MRYLLLFSALFITSISIADDKKTLIDRINEVEEIPVYIIHGKVKSNKYNVEQQKVPLTKKEQNTKRIDTIFPSEIDTLLPAFMDQLKQSFDTEKFTFILSGTEDEVYKDIKAKKYNFVAIMKYSASYDYDVLKKVTRVYVYTKQNTRTSYIIAYRKLSVRAQIGFLALEDNNLELKNVGSLARAANENFSFEVKDYTNNCNANYLMQKRNPIILLDRIKNVQNEAIIKLAEKQKKKHNKALKKRKK